MKIIMTTAAVIALSMAPASASGLFGGNTQGQAQGQAQGQLQGQAQGQNQGQNQGQSQSANNRNSINVEGGVGIGMGAAYCSNGVSLGVPGTGAIGFAFSDKDCKIVQEANLLREMGRSDLAINHLTHIKRVAETVRASQPATTASTMSAPKVRPVVAYRSCYFDGKSVHVEPKRKADTQLAVSQCRAAIANAR